MTHRKFTVKRCSKEASFYEFESKIVPAHFLCVLTSFFFSTKYLLCAEEKRKNLKTFISFQAAKAPNCL